jgi:hypothetical protein
MERRAAAIFGGRRFPASIGGPADFETERFVGQVKNTNRLSQGELGRLCEQIAEYGFSRGKLGVVVTKAAAGRGNETPIIISATAEVWKRILAEFRK